MVQQTSRWEWYSPFTRGNIIHIPARERRFRKDLQIGRKVVLLRMVGASVSQTSPDDGCVHATCVCEGANSGARQYKLHNLVQRMTRGEDQGRKAGLCFI